MNKDSLEEIISIINKRTNIKRNILEKDYYVCLILKELSIRQVDYQAYFKGGTAIYKILDHMNRFSEDIDLSVKNNILESNTKNRNRLKKSALGYSNIDGLKLLKEKTIDKKGSVTAFYEYDSLFDYSDSFKYGIIQVESTSFTVSKPYKKYTIQPLIYKYATLKEKEILKSYGICEFQINIIRIERIFVDKIFATEFYYVRNIYSDVSKHLYDICILLNDKRILKLLNNKNKLLSLIKFKRQEEKARLGGISEMKKIFEFSYLNNKLNDDIVKSFYKMQEFYVLDDLYKISIDDVSKTIVFLLDIFKKYNM